MILKLLSKLPLSALYWLSGPAYFLSYYVFRYRRKVVTANLSSAYPELSAEELVQRAKSFYRHYADVSMEIIHAHVIKEQELERRVTHPNMDVLDPYIESGQSFLLLSAHFANWEWLMQSISLKLPVPFDGVYKPLHDATSDAFFYKSRSRFGADLIDLKDFTREVIKRKGSQRSYAILADQKPQSSGKAHITQFLNRETRFFVGPEKIAQFVKIPVVFVRMARTDRGFYEVRYEVIAEPPYAVEKDSYPITERYVRELEKHILQQPESFLWSNRRWRQRGQPDYE